MGFLRATALYLLLLLSLSSIRLEAQDMLPYYGADFYDRHSDCASILRSVNGSFLIQDLHRIHWSHHLLRPGGFDELLDHSPSQVELSGGRIYNFRKNPSYVRIRQMMFGMSRDPETNELVAGFDVLQGEEVCEVSDELLCRGQYGLLVFYHTTKTGGRIVFSENEIPNWPFRKLIPKVSDGVNTEHVHPKSRMVNTDKYPRAWQQADPHILRAADPKHNSIRGNLRYAEVKENLSSAITFAGSKLGEAVDVPGLEPSSQHFYEPPKGIRGIIARALFYYAVVYGAPMDPIEEHFLRKWHAEEPPTDYEKRRNNRAYEAITTRNPFIDHPELVSLIPTFGRGRKLELVTPN